MCQFLRLVEKVLVALNFFALIAMKFLVAVIRVQVRSII